MDDLPPRGARTRRWELAWTLAPTTGGPTVHVMMNASDEDLEFEIPASGDGPAWRLVIATGRPTPDDLTPLDQASEVSGKAVTVGANSTTVLYRES